MTESNMPEKDKSLLEIENFVKDNIVEGDDLKVACGDGRYTAEQSMGAIRTFGGDFGILMAIMGTFNKQGIDIKPEKLISSYADAVKKIRGDDAKLYYHTDTHHPIPQMGCGHIAKASGGEYKKLYNPLNNQQVGDLYNIFVANPMSEVSVMEGEHKEKAVILVYGKNEDSKPKFSVNSSDDKGNMYFVVDAQRAGDFIKKVFPIVGKNLEKYVSSDEVIKTGIEQMGATASILAGNLEQFKVAIMDDGSFQVNRLGKVEPYRE